ncbi:PIG-M-domain-containing protein [Schizophyllum amplum]|uniref:GPI mannosyltransferase 1 n=1 Tax=Schizophyllum amplum TaxID=97359 RepID=A0A550CCU5_9AGAR|nr:PIG-M-domain-containing protein [Auriculariopsis ampla]
MTLSSYFTIRNVLVLAIIIRFGLIVYSEWHDAHSVVKYTDIDIAPYTRETYRYTPLLALLMLPNEWLHPSFGKYLFAACDIVNGLIIYRLLCSEAILSTLVLLTLYAALKKRWDAAAVLLGVSTHWKIYPFVYGVGCLGVITSEGMQRRGKTMPPATLAYYAALANWRTLRFLAISAGTFFALGLGCYAIWGYPFLYESYLYHLHRLDHRHNFSPYFYLVYLSWHDTVTSAQQLSATSAPQLSLLRRALRSPLTSFIPQMTAAFVLFNKVCTSQYFLWYLLLLPLIMSRLRMRRREAVLCVVVWALAQAVWLFNGYRLEFLGENVFLALWASSLVYVLGHGWVLGQIIEAYEGAVQGRSDGGVQSRPGGGVQSRSKVD